MKDTGFVGGSLLSGRQGSSVVSLVIDLLVLGWWNVAEFFVESLLVVEADPGERLMLCVLVASEAAAVDELGLEGPVETARPT